MEWCYISVELTLISSVINGHPWSGVKMLLSLIVLTTIGYRCHAPAVVFNCVVFFFDNSNNFIYIKFL